MAKKEEEKNYQTATLSSTTTKNPEVTTTTKNPEVTTTTKQDQVVQKVEQAVGPRQEEIDAYRQTIKEPLANAYGVDPNSGMYSGSIAELLGFDPTKRAEELRKQEQLARFKQKEASWRNALGVITDVVTAAAGGNVYKRDKDNIAAQEGDKADKAKAAIQEIADAIPTAIRQREAQYRQAEQEQLQKYMDKMTGKVTTTTTQGGGSTTQKTGGDSTTTKTGGSTTTTKEEVLDPTKTGAKVLIGSRYYDAKTPVRVARKGGGYINFEADTKDAVSYARLAISRMSQWLNKNQDKEGTQEYQKVYSALSDAGIVDPLNYDPNNDNITGDDYLRFLQNGRVFMIDDAETELQNLYKKSTGKNLVISTETKGNGNSGKSKGWGVVPQTDGTQKETDDKEMYEN